MAPESIAVRSTDRWKVPVTLLPSLEAFLALKSIESGIITIDGFPYPIDIYARIVPGRPIFLSFHGAFVRKPEIKLPYFTGLEIVSGLDVSVVAFCDPTLYADPSLQLAWFAGARAMPLQNIMPSVIAKMIALASASNLMFFGVSGGGFAALNYSENIEGALCVAVNPQTDILQYNPSLVENYGRVSFGHAGYDQVKSSLPSEINAEIISPWASSSKGSLIYIQNNSDWHVGKHLNPFMAKVASGGRQFKQGDVLNEAVSGRVWLALQNYGQGHVAPSWDYFRAFLSEAFKHSESWANWLSSGGPRTPLSIG